MANTSATGGYLRPTNTPLPGNLSLADFLHDVLVGVTGIDNTLVRPDWQPNPPKQPAGTVNWLAFGVKVSSPTPYSAQQINDDGTKISSQRQVQIEVAMSFYGPLALDYAQIFQDGIQVAQNLEVLRTANMGFVSTSQIQRIPDLINEVWVDRQTMSLFLNWQVDRTYEILNLLKAEGVIKADAAETVITVPFETPEEV